MIAAILFGFSAIFIKARWLRYGVGMVSVGAPYFFITADPATLWAIAASIIFGAFAVYRLGKEHLLSFGFSLTKIFRAGIPLYFTITSLILAAFFFSMLNEERAVNSLLPRSAFDASIKALTKWLGLPGEGVGPDTTINEIVLVSIKDQLKSQGIDLSKIPRAEFDRLITAQRQELARQYGLKLTGEERVSDVLYNAIAGRIRDLVGPYAYLLPVASALAFFFAFKALTFPLYYLALLVGYLMMRIMAGVGVLKLEKQAIVVERLSL